MNVRHDEFENGGEFTIENEAERLGEMTYRRVGQVLFVDHTWVDDRMRGKGAARDLLDAVVRHAREHGEKIVPLCPYVRSQFERDDGLADVLKELPPKAGR